MSPMPVCHSPTAPPPPPVNKRLDEWVTPERLDLQRVQGPRKEAKTPTKNGLPGSRPDSPERDPVRGQEGTAQCHVEGVGGGGTAAKGSLWEGTDRRRGGVGGGGGGDGGGAKGDALEEDLGDMGGA